MSRTVDERVVSMQFDNSQFESNVQTSLGTISKLKESLNFKGASKGLDELSDTAKRFDMSAVSNAVHTVGLQFNAMYTIADEYLRDMVRKAKHYADNLIKAFTIDPVKSGLQEYETQLGAIQTILANTQSKGSTLEDVNAALDELNKYADMTIYNFTEMTRNIGTFTAAGVGLEDSVASIKGIANLAAISGSTSQQASTAMYQLSQALASGTVKLMDWNSVVNAGMGGQVFQDALKRTAKQMGVNIDAIIEKAGSFRESLSKGWLTSDILNETLAQLAGAYDEADLLAKGYSKEQAKEILELAKTAGDAATKVKTFTQLMDTLKEAAQSGWAQTWRIIVGDFEEAKELWTEISNIFGGIIEKSAEARNSLLSGALDTNWEQLITKINDAGVETSDFEEHTKNILKDHGYDVDALIEKYGSLEEVFRSGAVSSDLLQESVDSIGDSVAKIDLSGIDRDLKRGMKNDDVKLMQEALSEMGYDIGASGVDGIFGRGTENALKEFQKANGLEPTGILDPDTLAAMNKEMTIGVENIDELSETSKGLIQNITDLGGRELLIESLMHVFDGLKAIITPIGEAFREIFPATTSEQLYSLIEGFYKLTAKFKLLEENRVLLDNIKKTFKGLFSVIGVGWEFLKAIGKGIVDLLGNFSGLGSGILAATGSLGEWVSGLHTYIKNVDIFGVAVDKVTSTIGKVIDAIKAVYSYMSERVETAGFQGFLDIMTNIWNFIQKIGSKVAEFGTAIGSALVGAFRSGDISNGLGVLNGGLTAAILLEVKSFVGGLSDVFGDAGGMFEGLKGTLDEVKNCFIAWQNELKASTLIKIAGAIAILTVAILIISTIDPAKLSSSLGTLTMLFANLLGSMAIFNRISGNAKSTIQSAITVVAMSTAILILAGALKMVSSLSWSELTKGLIGIAGLLGLLVGTMYAFSKMDKIGRSIRKSATAMVIFAVAIKVLASACKDIATLSWQELAKGLVGVGALLAAVSIFLNNTKFGGKAMTNAIGIVVLSAAIKVLASACTDFAQLSWEGIGKGLAAIGALLLGIALFAKLTGNAKKLLSTGTAMVVIAASMKIFASAMSDFSGMSWDQIGRGLAAMAGALLAVAIATRLMPKNLIGIGLGVVIIAGALMLLSNSLGKMGGMSWEEIGRGLVALGGSMFILANGLYGMNGTLAGSAALLVAAAAIAIITPALKVLGGMELSDIGKALLALAGAFVIMGVAGFVLGPLLPVILGLSAALALLGIGVLAVGAGVAALGIGIGLLATGLASGATAIVAGMSAIVLGIADLIPALAVSFGEGIIAICGVIADGAPALGEAIKAIVLTLVDVLVACVPAIADGALQLIVGLLAALAQYTPEIVDNLMLFLIGLLDGIAARMPELIASAMNLIASFFSGIIDALMGMDTGVLIKSLAGVGIITALIFAFSALTPFIAPAMIGILGFGAIVAELALVLAAIGALAQIPGLEWLIGEGGDLMMNIGNALGKFVGGILGGIAEGFTASLPQIGTDLSTFMTNLAPFLEGAASINPTILDNVNALTGVILAITAANILESITSWITGGSSITTFAENLEPLGTAIANFSTAVSGIDENAVTCAANAGAMLAEMASLIPTEGGLVSLFTGTSSIDTFATQIVTFGTALADFATEVSGIDETKVTAAANAGKALSEMASAIPATGGLFSLFTGDNDMETFGTQLKPFGTALADFATEVANIDEAKVTAAANAGKAMSEMANTIPNSGGLISFFTGNNDMSTFASQLKTFGSGIADFSTEVAELNTDNVVLATLTATTMIGLGKKLSASSNVWNLGEFGSEINNLGVYLGYFYSEIEDIDTTVLSSVVTQVSRLSRLSTTDVTGLNTFGASLQALGESGIDDFITAFSDAHKKVVTAFRTLMQTVTSSVRGMQALFRSAGSYLSEGVAHGIGDSTYIVVAKATAVARAAATAMRKELRINSPSKEGYEIGSFLGMGFVNALDDYATKSYAAGAVIADSARVGLSSAIAKVSSLIENGIDTQPTIRPVLDLSDISSGAGAINGMLSVQPSVGVLANVASISSSMNRNQNGANDDVVSAIEALGRTISGRTGDTYQINGVTYDDGSNITNAVKTLVRAAKVERRI